MQVDRGPQCEASSGPAGRRPAVNPTTRRPARAGLPRCGQRFSLNNRTRLGAELEFVVTVSQKRLLKIAIAEGTEPESREKRRDSKADTA